MDKQIGVHPYNEILLDNKKEQTTAIQISMGELQTHRDRLKKIDTKEYIAYDSTYMMFWKRQNIGMENRSVVASDWNGKGEERGLDQKGEWGIFSA